MKTIRLMSLATIITATFVGGVKVRGDGEYTPSLLNSYIELFRDDSNFTSENILAKFSSYGVANNLSLETNLALNIDPDIYGDSIRFYTYKKQTKLGGSQSLMENTISRSSGTKSRHAIVLNEVEFWPFMQGQIQNNYEYNARIATYRPVGSFQLEQYSREGSGYSTLEPQIALSWLNKETSVAVSVLSGLNFDNGNTTGDYQSDVFRVDTTVAHFTPLFGGFLGVGANGYYLKQISADSVSVARLGSSKMRSGGIGPVLFYLHDIGKNELIFGAKWLPKVDIRNTSMENFIRLELTLIF